MNYLAAKSIGKYFGERLLFENLSFGIAKGEKIALIADNGTGKSTLLKMLAQLEEPDEGSITWMKDLRIGFLAQDPAFAPQQTIEQLIKGAHSGTLQIIDRYQRALAAHTTAPSRSTEAELVHTNAQMDAVNGWDYERQLDIVLTNFLFTDRQRVVETLSGGEQKRLALALVLAQNLDLLILDEPTNHLDIEMIEWLEKFLAPATTTLLVVSHDRYFLDQVCNHIWEMHSETIYHHAGNYAYYLEKKAERLEVENTELAKSKQLYRKELEWMRRSPQARTTKAKSRINEFYRIKEKAHSGKLKKELQFDVRMERLGGKIIELHNIHKSYDGRTLINDFTYTFKKRDRVGIVGPNGAGKSTLLRILVGEEKVDRGKVKRGQTLKIGYYRQDGMNFNPEQRVIDALKEIAEVIVMSGGRKVSAAQMLEHFHFSAQMQFTPVGKLSGGEQRRLYLLTVLMQNPNFLVLDEPTNDLDLATLNKLEEFLATYRGCVVMVTHDRYFMDNLVDHLFIFSGNGEVKGWNGTYSEYRHQASNVSTSPSEKSEKAKAYEKTKAQKRKDQNRQRQALNLEREIEKLEKKREQIELELTNTELSLAKITELSQQVGDILQEIEEKTEQWMDIAGET